MIWARIPCDKLDIISQFGYELEHQDGYLMWFRGPENKIYCVDSRAPRFQFESAGEAAQAGATAIRISSERDAADFEEATRKLKESQEYTGDSLSGTDEN